MNILFALSLNENKSTTTGLDLMTFDSYFTTLLEVFMNHILVYFNHTSG